MVFHPPSHSKLSKSSLVRQVWMYHYFIGSHGQPHRWFNFHVAHGGESRIRGIPSPVANPYQLGLSVFLVSFPPHFSSSILSLLFLMKRTAVLPINNQSCNGLLQGQIGADAGSTHQETHGHTEEASMRKPQWRHRELRQARR